MFYIGIDTGKNTGVAIWGSQVGMFFMIDTMPIHRAMQLVLEWNKKTAGDVFVIFEDARQRKFFGNSGREKWQGAGSIKRDAVIWEDFLTDHGIQFRAVPPAKGATKKSQEQFRNITGWTKRTSEHARDAAMLVYCR
jgi:hypothetical protein